MSKNPVTNYNNLDRAFWLEESIQVNKALLRMFGPGPALLIQFLYASYKQREMEALCIYSTTIADQTGLTCHEVEKYRRMCEKIGLFTSDLMSRRLMLREYHLDYPALLDLYRQHKENEALA